MAASWLVMACAQTQLTFRDEKSCIKPKFFLVFYLNSKGKISSRVLILKWSRRLVVENVLWAYSPVMWRGSLLVTGSLGEILGESSRSTLPVIKGMDITLLLR